jgi:hypothetical protein
MADDSDSVNIRIGKETWQRLNSKYKNEPGKTWDDVMQELLAEAEGAAEDDADPNRSQRQAPTAD